MGRDARQAAVNEESRFVHLSKNKNTGQCYLEKKTSSHMPINRHVIFFSHSTNVTSLSHLSIGDSSG